MWCDSEIAGVDEHSLDDSPFPLEPKGGGGTDMREITKWCVDNAPDADACVIFTDGYTPYPEEGEEEVPTLWVMTGEPYQIPDYITYVEFEVDQVLQHLRANSSALIASIEEDTLWQKQ